MAEYAKDTMVLSFTKTNHPSYQAILSMGSLAVPFLLEDVQSQHPDGSWTPGERQFSYWGATSLLWQITAKSINTPPAPILPEKDRGRLAPIRKLWVDWGIANGYLTPNDPKIPLRFNQVHRFVPKRFFGLRNYIWRLTTLPNKHRMKHSWDYWRAI